MHPYEMYQLAAARRGRVVKIRPGSLYHTVSRLEGEAGAHHRYRPGGKPARTHHVRGHACGPGGARPTGERHARHSGARVPAVSPPRPGGGAQRRRPPAVVELLRERLDHLTREIDELETAAALACSTETPRIFLLGNEFLVTVARAEHEWLSALVADIDSGALPCFRRNFSND